MFQTLPLPCEKILPATYITGRNLLLFLSSQPALFGTVEDEIDLREINKITVQSNREDGVGDLCSARRHFDLPHQGKPLLRLKWWEGETTRRGEDETGDSGEDQGGREVKVVVISFTVFSNDIPHPGGGWGEVTADLVLPHESWSHCFINPPPPNIVSIFLYLNVLWLEKKSCHTAAHWQNIWTKNGSTILADGYRYSKSLCIV